MKPFGQKTLSHIDDILMAGDKPVTKKMVARTLLGTLLSPSATTTPGMIVGGARGALHRHSKAGMKSADLPDDIKRGYSILSGLSESPAFDKAVDLTYLAASLPRQSKAYKETLKERRRLAAGIAGAVTGTGALAGGLSAVALNQLTKAAKNKKDGSAMRRSDLMKKASAKESLKKGLSKALEQASKMKDRAVKEGKELHGKYLGRGGGGLKDRAKKSIESTIYGKRPGKLRTRRVRERLESMRRDKRRLKTFMSGALSRADKAMENKAVLPAAIAGGTGISLAAILKDRSGKKR